jgi:acyl-coenzyme A synthetase/AMP-(fatty) acid ligase
MGRRCPQGVAAGDRTAAVCCAVADWLTAAQVTFFQGIPSFIAYVVAALEASGRQLPTLENVIIAGEVLPPGLCDRMRAVFPRARLHNMFGPTECVLASRYEFTSGNPEHRRVPIGQPITGRRLLLLDGEGRPVAGYPEHRVYHAGDFGRIGADGDLRCLGRRDAQVKVRGIRINMDEVEAVLTRQSDVRGCKIVDVPVAGHVQIVAFVELDGSPPPEGRAGGAALADPRSAASWRRGVAEALGSRAVPARVKALRTACPGALDQADPRVQVSVDALVDAAAGVITTTSPWTRAM